MSVADRLIASISLSSVAFCGAADGSATAITFGALALLALRLDAQRAFVSRHGNALGIPLALAAIVSASTARAAIICAIAFAAGRLLGPFG